MSFNNELIGPIAAFIGARLQYPCPEINGAGNPWMSTINVAQHKEKFNYIRVYCDLACHRLVMKYWDFLKVQQVRVDAGEKPYIRTNRNVVAMLKQHVSPPEEFFKRCVKHDAIHYRKVYTEMVAIRPEMMKEITSQADHPELNFPQLDQALAFMTDMFRSTDWGKNCLIRYRCGNNEELFTFLTAVYNPSYDDVVEIRD